MPEQKPGQQDQNLTDNKPRDDVFEPIETQSPLIAPNSQKNTGGTNLFERFGLFVVGVIMSVGRTTVRYFKNIPHRIIGFIKQKQFEHKRLPKRKSPNRIYQLVGYTTKSYVNRKFRRERFFSISRSVLLFAIILVLVIIFIKSIVPILDPRNYEQIFGISDMDELTENDPFTKDDDTGIQVFNTERSTESSYYIQSLEPIPETTAVSDD